MSIKVYNFKYSKLIDKWVNYFLNMCNNFAVPILIVYFTGFILGLLGLGNSDTVDIFMALTGVAVIVGIICTIKYCVGFKGIILYDTYMEITTQILSTGKNKPKFVINYSDIDSVYHSTFNIRYDRRKARKSFIAGDMDDYIELTLKGGKQFCFTVDNQSDFLQEVMNRMSEN